MKNKRLTQSSTPISTVELTKGKRRRQCNHTFDILEQHYPTSNTFTTSTKFSRNGLLISKSYYTSCVILYILVINCTFFQLALASTTVIDVTNTTLSPTMNITSSSTYFENSSTSSLTSTLTSSSTYIPQEWEGVIPPFPTLNDTTTYSTINENTNVTRIIYSYTLIHLNTISSDDLLKNVNTSIVQSFTSILDGMDNITKNTKLGNLVKKNKEDIDFDIGNDWRIKNISCDYFIPTDLSKSLAVSNGKYTATSIYIYIQAYFPSLTTKQQQILKDVLLSKHITTYIGNVIKQMNNTNDEDTIQSSMYFQPVKTTRQFELSFKSDISDNLYTKSKHQFKAVNYLLTRLKEYWNSILVNRNYYRIDIKDNITLNMCHSKKDCDFEFIVKHEEDDEEEGRRERGRYKPFLGRKSNYDDLNRRLEYTDDQQERRLPSLGNMISDDVSGKSKENDFYYILLPINITFEYYINDEYINYEAIFQSLDEVLIDQKEQFWMDFYKNILMILGDGMDDTSKEFALSLSYIPINSDEENDIENDLYSDDYLESADILQSFIAMFIILSICLVLVYCGKFQDRRRRQKIVPFDGSIPVEI